MTDPSRETKVQIDWHTGVPLAQGGSGEVVRAYSPQLGRDIAIKYLRQEAPGAIERMLREARTQASLDHPHILPIHATGVHLDRHYIAMDLVNGQALDRYLAERSTEHRLELFDQVLDAMANAHAQGVVHRDLKPGNLMVEERAGQPHAWVMDFGLARRPDDVTLTLAGDALGTPGYMAPEQARGDEGADPRSDVYALGVVLYQLLTGALPYRANTPMALVMQAASGQIVPVAEIRRRLPEGLARIVVRCLEVDPDRRYPNANALRADLAAFTRGERLNAPLLGRQYRFKRWSRTHPWRARLAITLGAVLLIGAALLVTLANKNRRALNTASALIAEAERARGDWYVDQLLPLHDQRGAEQAARATVARLEQALDTLDGAAAARVDAAMADLLDAIGEPEMAFDRARRAWQRGYQNVLVAARAARARLRAYGERRLAVVLSADPASLPGLLDQLRAEVEADLAPYLDTLPADLHQRISASLDEGSAAAEFEQVTTLTHAAAWQDRLLDLQPAAAAAIERLSIEGASGLNQLDVVESALQQLVEAVRSYRPAYRIGCQLESARQLLRTMQSDATRAAVSRELCDAGLQLNPDDPELLASSSMQLWQHAKDLRRDRQAYEQPLALAIDQAERALAIQPASMLARLALGSALQIKARQQLGAGQDPRPALERSLQLLEYVHRLRPNDVNVMNSLAVTWTTFAQRHAGQGDTRAALAAETHSLAWLERAAKSAPNDRRLMHNMLSARTSLIYQAAMLGDDPTDATRSTVEQLAALADAHPDYVSPLNTLGLAWWTLGLWQALGGEDPEAAMRAAQSTFERALAQRPDWESPRINHAGVARQWYTLSASQPTESQSARVAQALATYRELDGLGGELSEFGCQVAEILTAQAESAEPTQASELLREAEALSQLERNIEWNHGDCMIIRARIGRNWASAGDQSGPVIGLWNETQSAVRGTEDPLLLIAVARFALAAGHTESARRLIARIPPAFRHRVDDPDWAASVH